LGNLPARLCEDSRGFGGFCGVSELDGNSQLLIAIKISGKMDTREAFWNKRYARVWAFFPDQFSNQAGPVACAQVRTLRC